MTKVLSAVRQSAAVTLLAMKPSNVTTTVAIGFVAGLASGLLGVGGGIVMVPLLVYFQRLSQHEAHATSLAAIVPIAAAAVVPFAIDGSIDLGIASLLAIGSMAGAPLGARAMAALDEGPLKVAFGGVGVTVALIMLVR